MAHVYTISVNGAVYGPVLAEKLKQDIAQRLLGPGTYLWNARDNRWVSVLQDPELYHVYFKHQELQLASLADPANPNRRIFVTNRRLLIHNASTPLGAAVDSARRLLGTKLPQGSLALPLEELLRVEVRPNPTRLAIAESLMVAVEYYDAYRQLQSLSFTIYPADKAPLLKALGKARPTLPVADLTSREQFERLAEAGATIQIQNIQGDLVQEKVATKVEDRSTHIQDSVISRSSLASGPPSAATESKTAPAKAREQQPSPAYAAPSNVNAALAASLPPPPRECQSCGQLLKAQWRRCPYCED